MRGLCSPFGLHTSNMQSIWTAYFKYAVHLDMYVNYESMIIMKFRVQASKRKKQVEFEFESEC